MPYSYQMASWFLYSAPYHRQYCTLHSFEQFGALYMRNLDDKHLMRPGFNTIEAGPEIE